MQEADTVVTLTNIRPGPYGGGKREAPKLLGRVALKEAAARGDARSCLRSSISHLLHSRQFLSARWNQFQKASTITATQT